MKRKKNNPWKKTSSFIKYKSSQQPREDKRDQNNVIHCPICQGIISITGKLNDSCIIECPICEHIISLEKPTAKKEKNKKHIQSNTLTSKISDHLIELILFTIGLIFLIQPTMNNIKISFTLMLISSILFFLMTGEREETTTKNSPSTTKPYFKRRLHTPIIIKKIKAFQQKILDIPLSNRISIILILWTLFLFIITTNLEIYFILIFIGVLITRELTDLYTSNMYKKRLNAYIIIFLFTYIVLITQKIMEILST